MPKCAKPISVYQIIPYGVRACLLRVHKLYHFSLLHFSIYIFYAKSNYNVFTLTKKGRSIFPPIVVSKEAKRVHKIAVLDVWCFPYKVPTSCSNQDYCYLNINPVAIKQQAAILPLLRICLLWNKHLPYSLELVEAAVAAAAAAFGLFHYAYPAHPPCAPAHGKHSYFI